MKTAALLLLLVSASVLIGQIRPDVLTPVPLDDPAMPTLSGWQQKMIESYNKSIARATFSSWSELPFPSLKKLFPGLRFFTASWSEHSVPGKEKEAIGLAISLEATLARDAERKIVKKLSPWDLGVPFGDLLATNKVSISTTEDAKLVWDAFCDLHQKHWKYARPIQVSEKERLPVKVSDTVWHLGNKTNDGIHVFYEVTLDARQIVTAASLHFEQPKGLNSK